MSVCCFENKYYYCEYDGYSFCAEMIKNKLVLHYGYEGIVTSAHITVAGFKYDVVHNPVLTSEEVMHLDCDAEGLIVSVDGIEYKVKKSNTVDLRSDGKKVFTQDGIPYSCFGESGSVGINEYDIVDGKAVYVRARPDKTVAQSQAHISYVVNCPTFADFSHVFYKYKDRIIFQKFNDILCTADAKYYLKSFLLMSNARLLTMDLIKRTFMIHGLRTDFNALSVACNIPVRGMRRVTTEEISDWKVSLTRVSCSDIFHYVKKYKLCMPIEDMCKTLVNKGYSVAPRRLFFMACRGSFSCTGDSVFVARYKKYARPADVAERIIQCRNDTVSYVNAYGVRNRNTKFSKTLIYDHLLDSLGNCNGVVESCPGSDVLKDSIGSVVITWLRLIDEKYPSMKILDDETIRDIFERAHLFGPFRDKIMTRIMTYGCIRDHFLAGNHQCNSGAHFKIGKDKN
jgi:hypothetical protein